MRTAIVLGASGQVGVFALPLLAARGWRVVAVSRGNRPVWYPDLDGVEWLSPDRPSRLGADALLSAGPLRLAGDWLAANPGIGRVAATSTTSVLAKAESADPAERRQMTTILADEQALAQACEVRDIPLCLLRPTLVYGCGLDRNLSLLAAFIRRFGFLPLARDARGRRQPLHAEDLGTSLVAGLEAGANLVSPLVGGSTITYTEMAERLFAALNRQSRLLRLPTPILAAAAGLAGALTGGRGVTAEMVRRQARDLVFDDGPARDALGIRPRPFRPGGDDFERPSAERLRALAGRPGSQRC